MCSGNCLIACSDEIDRDRTAVLGEDRQSPVIAAKTRTYREFNAHVFHRPAKENPDLTELERSGQGKLTEMVRGVVPAILPNGRHKRGELEAGPIVTDWRGRFRPARVKALVEAHPKDFPQPSFAHVAFDVADLKIGETATPDDPIRVKRSPFALAKLGNPRAIVEFNERPLGAFADVDAFGCLHLFDPLFGVGITWGPITLWASPASPQSAFSPLARTSLRLS
jgi:hypothetical protein